MRCYLESIDIGRALKTKLTITKYMKKNPEHPRTPQNTHHYILRRLADTDLYELAKKIEPLAEKIGFLPGNYTKFEKQACYSQPSKKPPDNADTS